MVGHGVVVWRVVDSPVRARFVVDDDRPITIALVTPPPAPAAVDEPAPVVDEPVPVVDEPAPVVEPPKTTSTPTSTVPTTTTPAETTSTPTPTAPPTTDVPASPGEAESVMRLPKGKPSIDTILGVGGPLGPSRLALEGGLDLEVDGAISDSERAVRKATRALKEDLADDAVSAGLADDWYRELNAHITASWKPATKQLNDGGESTNQLGMMKGLVEDTAAWGEMWNAYMDLAKQYANGVQPRLESVRIERLKELMRSRQGSFRMSAIAEIELTVDPKGKVQLLEFTAPSGHPGIDEHIGEAITHALAAMPTTPPPRLHNGRGFTSKWRLRATWSMVPPTAFFSGAGFDITPKGFTVDVPFQIKLNTNVMLLRTAAPKR